MHRWEDYTIEIKNKANTVIGTLGTAHKFRGSTRMYGDYGCALTFSLERNDPWASVLGDGELHFIKVWRDGLRIWSGYQVKLERNDDSQVELNYIDFYFLPLSRMLSWRAGLPIAPATTLASSGLKCDDAIKWIVERTLGATAPASPTNAVARAFTNFSVAADKTEHPDDVNIDVTYQDVYEVWQRLSVAKDVDWQIYFEDTNSYPEFETWYQGRGTDKSEGEATEVIFTDANGTFTALQYGHDTTDHANLIYDRAMASEVTDATRVTNWLARDLVIEGGGGANAQTTLLEERAPQTYCELKNFRETPSCQWMTHFNIGDIITWKSQRMSYGPTDDYIVEVVFEIDEQGWEHLEIHLGKPKPDVLDQMRGGGSTRRRPYYIDWLLRDDADAIATPDADSSIGIKGGTGITTAVDSIYNIAITADLLGLEALADPGADRIIFWDDSESKLDWLIVNTGLAISATNLNAAHDLLSASHTNTEAHAATEGEIIISWDNQWTWLGPGTQNQILRMFIAAGRYYVDWQTLTLLDGTMVSDTTAGTVVRGDVITGQGTTPKWTRLAKGAAWDVLSGDGTDTVWKTPSSNPGAAQSLLVTDASGHLQLDQLTIDTYLMPDADNGADLGDGTHAFGNIFGNIGYFDNSCRADIYYDRSAGSTWLHLDSNTVSLVIAGSITMAAGKTVDGVDVGSHTHSLAYTGTASGAASIGAAMNHLHSIDVCTHYAAGNYGGTPINTSTQIADNGDHYHTIADHYHTITEEETGSTDLAHTHSYDKTNTPTGAPS